MKKKKMLVIFIIALMVFNIGNMAIARDFKFYMDTFDHWAFETIMWVSNEVELFNGYEDGTFKPDNNIKISEYITLLSRSAEIQGIIKEDNKDLSFANPRDEYFSNLEEDFWAYDTILVVMNYINDSNGKLSFKDIFPGNKFDPNRYITREEAVLLSSFFTSPPINDDKLGFYDIEEDYKYYSQLSKMVNNKIIEGYEDNTFQPESYITRAESAVILKKLYKDMEYLQDKYLQGIKLLNNPSNNRFMLFGNYDDREFTTNDKLYKRAISTLEYMSIIHYIPYEERHLYDSSPIETLKKLKDTDYWNILGINYYLITNGATGIDYERNYNELLEDYISREDISNEESLVLFGIDFNNMHVNIDKVILALDKWQESAEVEESKYNSLFIKSKVYLENGDLESALKLYNDDIISQEIIESKRLEIKKIQSASEDGSLVYNFEGFQEDNNTREISNGVLTQKREINEEIKKFFIMNKAYIYLHKEEYKNAEEILRTGWQFIETNNYDREFIGAIKEVLSHKDKIEPEVKILEDNVDVKIDS